MNATRQRPSDVAFVRWFVAIATLLLVGIALFNAMVGEPSPTSTDRNASAAANLKLRLLDRADDLDFVILGSSRVQRLDPTLATGRSGFNAGMVGTSLADASTVGRWLIDRASADGEPPPHLVLGLAAESFEPQGATNVELSVPHLDPDAVELPIQDRIREQRDDLERLLQLRTLRESLRTTFASPAADASPPHEDEDDATMKPEPVPVPSDVASRVFEEARGTGNSHATGPIAPSGTTARFDPLERAATAANLRGDGYLTSGAYAGATDVPETGWDEQTASFYRELAARHGTDHVDRSAKRALERLVAAANEVGERPTIALLPLQPRLARLVAPLGREAYEKAVFELLNSMQDADRIRLVDVRILDGSPPQDDQFYDGLHPRPELATEWMRAIVDVDPGLH